MTTSMMNVYEVTIMTGGGPLVLHSRTEPKWIVPPRPGERSRLKADWIEHVQFIEWDEVHSLTWVQIHP